MNCTPEIGNIVGGGGEAFALLYVQCTPIEIYIIFTSNACLTDSIELKGNFLLCSIGFFSFSDSQLIHVCVCVCLLLFYMLKMSVPRILHLKKQFPLKWLLI